MKQKDTTRLLTLKDIYAMAAQIGLNANPNIHKANVSDHNIAVRCFDQAEEMMKEKRNREGMIYE